MRTIRHCIENDSIREKIETLLRENFIGELVRVEFQGYFSQWPRYWQLNNWIATKEREINMVAWNNYGAKYDIRERNYYLQ